MFKIEIDGKSYNAEHGDMLIDVADRNGIYIPHFCYHKKLSIAANCRMCLVDVEGVIKPVPACATPVADGIKVFTKSEKTKNAQKSVMEFLLINHPLDCPICDQGGECELQDIALQFGSDVSRFTEAKRVVIDKNIGPLVATEMTRCINCTRCVRFAREIAGISELGVTGRSDWSEIGTYIEGSINSELSGNIIDICPVGALTSKPYRYSARPWEMKAYPSVAIHDAIGSNIFVHTYKNKVKRVVPRENEEINEVWISDRDRFSYEALYSKDRLLTPFIKNDKTHQEIIWEDALAELISLIKNTKPDNTAILINQNVTIEDLYLSKKIATQLGIKSIFANLNNYPQNYSINKFFDTELFELSNSNATLVIGSNIQKESPIINLKIRQSVIKNNAKVSCFNPFDFSYNFDAKVVTTSHEDFIPQLASLVTLANEKADDKPNYDIKKVLTIAKDIAYANKNIEIFSNDVLNWIINDLSTAKQANIIVGDIVLKSKNKELILCLVAVLAKLTNSKLNLLASQSNTLASNRLGLANTIGINNVLNKKKLIIALNIDLEKDLNLSAKNMLSDCKIVNITPFIDTKNKEMSYLGLPMAIFAEISGSYLNINNKLQSVKTIAKADGEAKPLWKILRVLGSMLNLENFEYFDTKSILEDAKLDLAEVLSDENVADIIMSHANNIPKIQPADYKYKHPYQLDSILRHSVALNKTKDASFDEKYKYVV